MDMIRAVNDSFTVCVAILHLSTITNRTPRPPPPLSLPTCSPSSALSILTTLDQDPVTDPPKRDWLQERREFCLPSPFLCLSVFSKFFSLAVTIFSFRLSRALPPVFIFSTVELNLEWKKTLLRVLHPQTPALLSSGWILKKQEAAQRVQIRFSWIVLLWLQTCPCYLSLAQLLWAVVSVCVHVIICAFRDNSWSHEHCGCGLLVHFCRRVWWFLVHSKGL